MSRLFTLDLSYGGKSLQALVGLRSHGYDLAFFVHYLDKEYTTSFPVVIWSLVFPRGCSGQPTCPMHQP